MIYKFEVQTLENINIEADSYEKAFNKLLDENEDISPRAVITCSNRNGDIL
jgi:hypothetical protein